MRVLPQSSDNADTLLTGILKKKDECKETRKGMNFFFFAKKMPELLVSIF